VMVGQLYQPGDPRRDGAFSIFYMGINLGAFLCNYVCGTLGERYGWHYGFGAAAVGMLAGLGLYMSLRDKYLGSIGLPPPGRGGSAPWFILTGIGLSAVAALAFRAGILHAFDAFLSQKWVAYTLGAAATVWSLWFIASQPHGDRGPVATIFIFTLFNAF